MILRGTNRGRGSATAGIFSWFVHPVVCNGDYLVTSSIMTPSVMWAGWVTGISLQCQAGIAIPDNFIIELTFLICKGQGRANYGRMV